MKKMLILIAAAALICELYSEYTGSSAAPEKNMSTTVTYSSSVELYSNNTQAKKCKNCSGTGNVRCNACLGSGQNSSYKYYTGSLKAISTPYCDACFGRGYNTCGRCHGEGVS